MATTVEVKNLWKTFQIPHERRTTLFENLTGLLRPNQYETYTVLKDVNFAVDEGECIGIIGDNGSGKSTLLKIIANILRPSKGTVKVEGKMTPFLELGVGFQPDLTVRENVGVYATVMGLSRKEIREGTDDVIKFAGLRKFEDTKLKNLSSGMQVRLAFSTAIQTEPDVLLVDEVLAVGDMEFQQKCFDIFNRYRKEGVTILFVSHDLGAVRKFCDKALLLKDGKQAGFDITNKIIDEYIYKLAKNEAKDEDFHQEHIKDQNNKSMEIHGVRFLDKNCDYNENFIAGDPFTVRIFYKIQQMVDSPIFGIAIYQNTTYCYATNTNLSNYKTGKIKGTGYIDLIIKRLPFLAGRFEVTVAVVDQFQGITYDWHDRRYSFNVQNPTRDQGMVYVEGSWRLSAN